MCKNWWLRAHGSVSNSRSNVINKVKKGLCDCMEFCHHFRCSLAEKQATGLHSTVVSIDRVNSNMMFKAKQIFKCSTQMFPKTLIQNRLRTLKKLYQKPKCHFSTYVLEKLNYPMTFFWNFHWGLFQGSE